MVSNWTTNPARIVIAAPQGRSGKTTVALGVCAALNHRGLKIQPFKKGPDYIDPSWLSAAAGMDCRSLDPFFLDTESGVIEAFLRGCVNADLSLIEGNHGLYDSIRDDGYGSTAHLARILKAPVILVVSAERMSRSVAAMVLGYLNFEPETRIAGVILNRVANQRHEAKLRQAIESFCKIPVLGTLPRKSEVVIPDRHLGLIPKAENDHLVSAIDACRMAAESHIDLQALIEIAQSAPVLPTQNSLHHFDSAAKVSSEIVRIGVIRDRAFTFYYPENLEALERAGAKLVFINSFSDHDLPDIQALIIGGGFPELFLDELSANGELLHKIYDLAERGLPVYAECAGLMYLSKQITYQAKSRPFAGVLPLDIVLEDTPQGHGYVIAEVTQENPFFPVNTTLRGHEFHHSKVSNPVVDLPTAYQLKRGSGIYQHRDAYLYKNVLASYTHLHADGSPLWAEAVVMRARKYAREQLYG